MDKLSKKKKILVLVIVLAALFVVLDFGYFSANFVYIFHGSKSVYRDPSAIANPSAKKMQPNTLIIDSLGITAPVIYITENNEKAYQAALINGVVHYPGTANPGAYGNCYIFGHSSDYIFSKGHYKTVFAVLPQIKLGAEITVSDQQGNVSTYIVTDSHVVASNDMSVLDQQGNTKKLITLQTSYPIGTALKRWVVVGELKE